MRFALGFAILWGAALVAVPAATLLVLGAHYSISIFQLTGIIETGCAVGAASVALAWLGAYLVRK